MGKREIKNIYVWINNIINIEQGKDKTTPHKVFSYNN